MRKSSAEAEFPAEAVGAAVGAQPTAWKRIESRGYGRVSAHWRVAFGDGSSAFVKHAQTKDADDWVTKERQLYEDVSAPYLPTLRGAGTADGHAFVAIEDLSNARWPPPWSRGDIDAVLATLDAVHATPAPDWLPSLDDLHDKTVGWAVVARDPQPLLGTGVCSKEWLDAALPELLDAVQPPLLAGGELLHLDVRSDNLCFTGDRTVLVDWNLACVGNGRFDVAFWLPSLRLEGGPQPWEVMRDDGPVAAATAGFFAARAGLPPPAGAPTVRDFQRAQLEVALPWAARELGLPAPTLPA